MRYNLSDYHSWKEEFASTLNTRASNDLELVQDSLVEPSINLEDLSHPLLILLAIPLDRTQNIVNIRKLMSEFYCV